MKKSILAIQMHSEIADFEANCNKIKLLIDNFYANFESLKSTRGKDLSHPDIIFLPELWTVGWACDCFLECASSNFSAPEFLAQIAKEYDVNIIGGSFLRKENSHLKNSCPIINRKGDILGFYDKIHLYSPDGEAKAVTHGNTPLIVDIEGLKIGLSICYDIRFPELFRSYISSENPPELLVNLSAWPKTRREQYYVMAKARAVENQSYFLALSQTGLIKDGVYNSGYSILCTPLGETIVELSEDEGFIFEEIDTDRVKNIRETFPNLLNRKVDEFGFCPKNLKVK